MVDMSAGFLAPQGGGFEPQRVFNWVLVIPGLEDTDLIRLSVEKVQMPGLSTAVMQMRYMNENVKVSGGASVGANSVTCRDFIDRPTFKVLNTWMEQVHDPKTGNIGYASDYKKQGTIQLVDTKGNVIKTVIAKGMWPSNMSFSELNYETDSGQIKITLTLQVDKYEIQF